MFTPSALSLLDRFVAASRKDGHGTSAEAKLRQHATAGWRAPKLPAGVSTPAGVPAPDGATPPRSLS